MQMQMQIATLFPKQIFTGAVREFSDSDSDFSLNQILYYSYISAMRAKQVWLKDNEWKRNTNWVGINKLNL